MMQREQKKKHKTSSRAEIRKKKLQKIAKPCRKQQRAIDEKKYDTCPERRSYNKAEMKDDMKERNKFKE